VERNALSKVIMVGITEIRMGNMQPFPAGAALYSCFIRCPITLKLSNSHLKLLGYVVHASYD
jgi:hypothetical protein